MVKLHSHRRGRSSGSERFFDRSHAPPFPSASGRASDVDAGDKWYRPRLSIYIDLCDVVSLPARAVHAARVRCSRGD